MCCFVWFGTIRGFVQLCGGQRELREATKEEEKLSPGLTTEEGKSNGEDLRWILSIALIIVELV